VVEKTSLQPKSASGRNCGRILLIHGTKNEGMVMGKAFGRLAQLQDGSVGGRPPLFMTVLLTIRSSEEQVNGALSSLTSK
jgi:hypothetical protein